MHLCRWDPYGHLRSIHNCLRFYDHSRPWITHCSIQRLDLYKSGEMTGEWRARYQKPVVLDEKSRKAYSDLERQMVLELPEDETVPVPVPAVPALAPVVPLFP